jgi:hypothetical protein
MTELSTGFRHFSFRWRIMMIMDAGEKRASQIKMETQTALRNA